MAQLSIAPPGDGKVIELGRSRVRVIEDGSTTDHRLGVIEISVAPHSDGPPQHRHAQHDDGFDIVSGTIRFTIGDTVYDDRPDPWRWFLLAYRTPSATPVTNPGSSSRP